MTVLITYSSFNSSLPQMLSTIFQTTSKPCWTPESTQTSRARKAIARFCWRPTTPGRPFSRSWRNFPDRAKPVRDRFASTSGPRSSLTRSCTTFSRRALSGRGSAASERRRTWRRLTRGEEKSGRQENCQNGVGQWHNGYRTRLLSRRPGFELRRRQQQCEKLKWSSLGMRW